MADGAQDVLIKRAGDTPALFFSQLWRYYFLSHFLN